MNRLGERYIWLLFCSLLLMAGLAQAASTASPVDSSDAAIRRYVESATDVYYQTRGDASSEAAPRPTTADYPRYRNLNSRLAIWVITQQHTYFGGFVLALPIFCLIIEVMGLMARDRAMGARYDRLARDFLRISLIAFSISATIGV